MAIELNGKFHSKNFLYRIKISILKLHLILLDLPRILLYLSYIKSVGEINFKCY
jgi:hypothetical protein